MASSNSLFAARAALTRTAPGTSQQHYQVRRLITSPAYRRHLLKKRQQQQQSAKTGAATINNTDLILSAFSGDSKSKPVDHDVPTLDVSKQMPTGVSELGNDALLTIAEMGNHTARIEVLKRHIMAVDNVDYHEATKTFETIAEKNREGLRLAVLPYQIGIATALVCGFGAIPMVFDVNIAMIFNHHFVTMDIPEPSDLDTPLEVGAWTWNWMEPPLGTASFVLLCLQFSREQMKNLGVKPYTVYLKERRAKMLARNFPKYDVEILQQFVESDPMVKIDK
jgi:hypothetical protein